MKNASTGWAFFDLVLKSVIYSIRLVPGSSPGQPIKRKQRRNIYLYFSMLILVDMGI